MSTVSLKVDIFSFTLLLKCFALFSIELFFSAFCNSICTYCSFTKRIYNEEIAHNYVLNLLKDLDNISAKSLSTIFIGGGTPSSLSNLDLEILLKKLQPLLKDNYEFTIESNPENLTFNKAKIFNKYGVNRVSIGVQTFNEKLLKIINRHHNKDIVLNTINLLKQQNIKKQYKKYDAIKNEGEVCDSIGFILKGSIYISTILSNYNEFVITKLEENGFAKMPEWQDALRRYINEFNNSTEGKVLSLRRKENK